MFGVWSTTKMGKSAPRVSQSPYEKIMAEVAWEQQLRAKELQKGWEDPLRQQVQPQISQALAQNPFSTKLSAADRGAYEGQYNQAKQTLMNTTGPGGLLRSQMAGLERDRANAISGAASQARETGLQRALGASAGALPNAQLIAGMSNNAMQGLGGAGELGTERHIKNAEAKDSKGSQTGSGVGSLLSTAVSAISMY